MDDILNMTGVDTDDLRALLELYRLAAEPGQLRRTPWTWAALADSEAATLGHVVQQWVDHYNQVHAMSDKELIPPCWPQHHGLAHELAALVWLHYQAHHDAAATPLMVADYHARYLPGFRSRLDRLLGRDPASCRPGEHPATWRSTADQQLDRYNPPDDITGEVVELAAQHFVFPI